MVSPVLISDDSGGRPVEKAGGPAREVLLKVSKWPRFVSQTDRSYAALLGAMDSHLTVGVARGKSAGVLLPGDRINDWDGTPVRNIFHLQEIMESWKLPEASLRVTRDFKDVNVTVPLKPVEVQLPEGAVTIYVAEVSMLGQTTLPDPAVNREKNPFKAAVLAIDEAYNQTAMMVASLWQIITGAVPMKALGGPMMIAKVAGDSAKAGWMAFFASMAVISINLGLVNLFPIPVLDGGQLVLLGFEGVKRSPIEESTIENFQKVGFVIVMSLVVLALYNDLSRFWSGMVASILETK